MYTHADTHKHTHTGTRIHAQTVSHIFPVKGTRNFRAPLVIFTMHTLRYIPEHFCLVTRSIATLEWMGYSNQSPADGSEK